MSRSQYSYKIAAEDTRPQSSAPPPSSKGPFERRLSRIAFDVTQQPNYGGYHLWYVFEVTGLPNEALIDAQEQDDARPGFRQIANSNKWGHSAVHLKREKGDSETQDLPYWLSSVKLRLHPLPDGKRRKIVETVAEAAPPAPARSEWGVWFGNTNDNRVLPHVGIGANGRSHPSDFLDFLAELLPAYRERFLDRDAIRRRRGTPR